MLVGANTRAGSGVNAQRCAGVRDSTYNRQTSYTKQPAR